MSSKNISQKNASTKLIQCENCRQNIDSEKMFLHEGFCKRNNVFCEHCEQVFLKEEYEEHIKDLPKNLTSKDTESAIDSKKSTSNDEESPYIDQSITTTLAPNPTLEFVQMPLIEEISISAPIIINESGQILSNKNKNEFLLPYLGINPSQNYYTQNQYNYGQNQYIPNIMGQNNYCIEQVRNVYNQNKFEVNEFPIKRANTQYLNNAYYSNALFNNLNAPEIINQDYYDYNSSNIIIKNNIVNYNNNQNIGKINNSFLTKITPQKVFKTENRNYYRNEIFKFDAFNEENEFNTLNKENNRKPKVTTKKINNSLSKKKKVPTDSVKSKFLTEQKTFIKRKKPNGLKGQNNTYKKAKVTKIYSDNISNTEYKDLHFKNKTENKNIYNILKQKEKKNNKSIKEFTIEENNKKNGNKELTQSLNKMPLNFSVLSPARKSKEEVQFYEEPNLRKSNVIQVKKKLFSNQSPSEIDKKDLLIRTQERSYREKIIINVNKDDNSKTVERNQTNLLFNFNGSPSKNSIKKPDYNEFVNINSSDQKGNINRRSLINNERKFIRI